MLAEVDVVAAEAGGAHDRDQARQYTLVRNCFDSIGITSCVRVGVVYTSRPGIVLFLELFVAVPACVSVVFALLEPFSEEFAAASSRSGDLSHCWLASWTRRPVPG